MRREPGTVGTDTLQFLDSVKCSVGSLPEGVAKSGEFRLVLAGTGAEEHRLPLSKAISSDVPVIEIRFHPDRRSD